MIFDLTASDRKVRVFSLNPTFIDQFRGKQPKWGYNGLGEFVFKRTYARNLPDGTSEEFWQTVQRVVEGCFNIQKVHCRQMGLPWKEDKAQASAQDMFQRIWDFKFTPPGRGLSVMGTDIVYDRGSAALQNCSFVSSDNIGDDFAAPFTFLMDMSMLGVGVVGYTSGAGKAKIQFPKTTEEPFVVVDSREGWVDLLRTALNSFVGKTHFPTVIDYSKIRGRGTLIKTFGGTASGPKPLHMLIENVVKLLLPKGIKAEWEVEWQEDQGRINLAKVKFTGEGEPYRILSTQIVDIFNYVGKAVVAGGVRRTAEIMFGDPEDQAFMNLKQDLEALNDRRWASNNSIFAKVGMDYEPIAKLIATNGEPGLIWLDNIREYSRMGGLPDHKDRRAMGTNPCCEMGQESNEMCNLVETYPAHHDSLDDFEKTLKMAYLYAKTVTLVPTHDPRANAVMTRNRRIGCSMSGITQAVKKLGRRQFLNWCDSGFKAVQKWDRVYSDWLGIPLSIKTTSVKPSGTVSLLCGATPGIHYPHSEYYVRHVRVANTSPLVEACVKAGYHVEPDPYADDTSVVAFPVHEKNFLKGKDDVTVWEQFANAADMQRHWADNQVSATITFRKDEVKDIQTCLETFETSLKGISMLPVGDDHGYKLPPYQAITKDQYEEMVSRISPFNFNGQTHDVTAEEKFCTNDTCTFKPAAK